MLMKAGLVLIVATTAIATASMAGCGSDCADLSGDWTIDQHCESVFVGDSLKLNQNGCEFDMDEPFPDFGGTISADGSITVGGTFEGDVINCTGTATTSQITLKCDDGCNIVIKKK